MSVPTKKGPRLVQALSYIATVSMLGLNFAACGLLTSKQTAATSPASENADLSKAATGLSLMLPTKLPSNVDKVKVILTEIYYAPGRPCSIDSSGKSDCPPPYTPFTKTYTFSTTDKLIRIDDLAPRSYTIAIDLFDSKTDKVYLHGDGRVTIIAGQTAVARITLERVVSDTGDLVIKLEPAPAPYPTNPPVYPTPTPAPVTPRIPAVKDHFWAPEPCPRDSYPVGIATNDSCANNDMIDEIEPNLKTCAERSIKSGDACGNAQDVCVLAWEKTCKSGLFKHGDGSVSKTGYLGGYKALQCLNKFIQPMCPISAAKAKNHIQYLTQAEREQFAKDVLNIKLATYEYKPEYSNVRGPQLGFIIDDMPKSPVLTEDGGHVNLYAYISAVVATVQKQEQEIKALKEELAKVKQNTK